MDKEYNTQLTNEVFAGTFRKGKGARVLYDTQNKILGSVSHDSVFNLSGDSIADSVKDEKRAMPDGKNVRVITYGNRYELEGDVLYKLHGGERGDVVGSLQEGRNVVKIALLSAIAVLLAAIIILIALIRIPVGIKYEPPVIEIRNEEGGILGEGTVGIFGDKVQPGSEGSFVFKIRNSLNNDLLYAFSITPQYIGGDIDYFPIEFRLKMNNVYMESNEWRTVEELAYSDVEMASLSENNFILEWRWAFENGNDYEDTLIGADGGSVSMVITLTAQNKGEK